MHLIRTCKEVHRLVAESMDRDAAFGERLSVRLHLAICDGCRRFARQMRFLHEALRRFPGDDGGR
jgi:hypothetical protein